MGFWGDLGHYLVGGGADNGLQTKGQEDYYARNYLHGALDSGQMPQAQAAQLGQAAQLATGPQDQFRGQQMQTANYLHGILTGNQAGAGEMAVNRQVGQATAAQQAAAQMARGSNAALAARNAARNTADLGVNGAGMAAQAQMSDQQNAAGQLGALLGQGRQQDIGIAGQNAELQQQRMLQQGAFNQQANMLNPQLNLQQQGMNSQYLAQLLGMDQTQFQNEMAKRGLAMQDTGILPGLLQAGGAVAASAVGGK